MAAAPTAAAAATAAPGAAATAAAAAATTVSATIPASWTFPPSPPPALRPLPGPPTHPRAACQGLPRSWLARPPFASSPTPQLPRLSLPQGGRRGGWRRQQRFVDRSTPTSLRQTHTDTHARTFAHLRHRGREHMRAHTRAHMRTRTIRHPTTRAHTHFVHGSRELDRATPRLGITGPKCAAALATHRAAPKIAGTTTGTRFLHVSESPVQPPVRQELLGVGPRDRAPRAQ